MERKRRGKGWYKRRYQEGHERATNIPDVAGLNYKDLYIHPNLNLPEEFKIPKFHTLGEVVNPMAHLRAYCDQFVGVGRDETL